MNEDMDEAGRIVDSFCQQYVQCSPFAEDRKLVDELAHEVVPCVEALLFATREGEGACRIPRQDATRSANGWGRT